MAARRAPLVAPRCTPGSGWGTVIRTAEGSGLNTAFFTYVGPPHGVPEWDEIDFEFLGKAPNRVEANYVVNGKIIKGKIVDLGFDSSKDFHDYAIDWAPAGIKWFVDGKEVYETPQGAALPHNPGYLFLSLWTGSSIEDSWMGPFKYTQPMTAEAEWVRYTPHQ
jgi:beta-glucanase (GH16 family)